ALCLVLYANSYLLEYLLNACSRCTHVLQELLGIKPVPSFSVACNRTGCGRVSEQRPAGRVNRSQPFFRRPKAPGKRVVATRVEDDYVQFVASSRHLRQHQADIDGLVLNLFFADDRSPYGNQIVYSPYLDAVTCIIEKADAAIADLLAERSDVALHVILRKVLAIKDLELEIAEGLSHRPRVIDRIQ